MSMLAEPRRKTKWSLNPRGKQWSEDSNKFGQKMLEKMGWTSGKGLGAREQGVVEHVRVSVKNDTVGIGFKDRNDIWTENQDEFNNILKNLTVIQTNKSMPGSEEVKILSGNSLEETSKLSQKRVHYTKFTRGKDVNKYNAKDLASIVGNKNLVYESEHNGETSEKEEVEESEENAPDPIGTKDFTSGVITIKGGNINDYFKNKLPLSLQNDEKVKRKSKFYLNDEDVDSGNETEKFKGFGFTKNNDSKSKNKKMNNLNYVFDNPCLDLNILDSTVQKNSTVVETLSRKRKREFINGNEDLCFACPDKSTPKKQKNDIKCNDDIRENFKDNCNSLSSKPKIVIKSEVILDPPFDLNPIKIKKEPNINWKNDSSSNAFENLGLNLNSSEENNGEEFSKIQSKIDDEVIGERKRKKKNKKEKNNDLNSHENHGLDLEFSQEMKSEKNKQKNYEPAQNGFENPGLDLQFPDRLTQKKIKKQQHIEVTNVYENLGLDLEFPDRPTPKKKDKERNSDFTCHNGYENPGLDLEIPERSTPKKGKKKKKNCDFTDNGYENPGLDLEFPDKETNKNIKNHQHIEVTTHVYENPGLDLEFPDRPTPKKKKREKNRDFTGNNGYENPGLDLETPDRPTPKKKKKEKDYSILTGGLVNPALDLSPSNDICTTDNYEITRTNVGLENCALDLAEENSCKKRVTFNNDVEYNTDISNKKKKKKKLDKYEVVNDKVKKKKKSKKPPSSPTNVAFVNEALNVGSSEEEIDNELNERKNKKLKRRNERRISLLETIVEDPEEENTNENVQDSNIEIDQEYSSKKKNKKKKKSIDNSQNNVEEIAEKSVENILKKQKDKKKSLYTNTEEVPTLDQPSKIVKEKKKKKIIEIQQEIEDSTELTIKKKKKKSKKDLSDHESKDKISNTEKANDSDDKLLTIGEMLNEELHEKTNNKDGFLEEEDSSFNRGGVLTSSKRSFKKDKDFMKRAVRGPTLLFRGTNLHEIPGYGNTWLSRFKKE